LQREKLHGEKEKKRLRHAEGAVKERIRVEGDYHTLVKKRRANEKWGVHERGKLVEGYSAARKRIRGHQRLGVQV